MINKRFGLLGKKLSHSFSKGYFTEKFSIQGLQGYSYDLFEIEEIGQLAQLLHEGGLAGLNVTIPYKESVIPFLDEMDPQAARIGAVNVIGFGPDGKTTGYNSDYHGFSQSLGVFIQDAGPLKALVLGTGGAAKAVSVALSDMSIEHLFVSQSGKQGALAYHEIKGEILSEHRLLVNASPAGMYPAIETCPPLPYGLLGDKHYLYDLVYNPAETLFMKQGMAQGALAKNGLEMLHLQAEKAWEIWNQK